MDIPVTYLDEELKDLDEVIEQHVLNCSDRGPLGCSSLSSNTDPEPLYCQTKNESLNCSFLTDVEPVTCKFPELTEFHVQFGLCLVRQLAYRISHHYVKHEYASE